MDQHARGVSLVVAARNDNYGGDFLHRMQTFVDVLFSYWPTYGLNGELVIVEWNPPDGRPRLRDALSWPKSLDRGTVRFVEVPNELHRILPNSNRIPLFEYLAKNVGIRRARGDFVLATNPDVIFTRRLMRFVSSGKLSPDKFYRVDRCDVDVPVPPSASVEDKLKHCARHAFRWNLRGVTITPNASMTMTGRLALTLHRLLGESRRLRRGKRKIEDQLHTNAAGDFMLMHRRGWNELRGYPELYPTSPHLDSYMCVMAAASGRRQVILRNMWIYHQEHERAVQRESTHYEQWCRDSEKMLRLQSAWVPNDENWGMGDHSLLEFAVE